MKIGPMLALSMLVATTKAVGAEEVEKIPVYVENDANVPYPLLSHARTIASDMFFAVGVQITWRAGMPTGTRLRREHGISVRLTIEDPKEFRSTVGGFTVPAEGMHITVLYNRLAWSLAKPGLTPALLAHVLVHEITHILEGVGRHSGTGVMKANWSSSDYYEMQTKTLQFAPEDIELIRRGLANRNTRAVVPMRATPSPVISQTK
jgi:hypothetical protein